MAGGVYFEREIHAVGDFDLREAIQTGFVHLVHVRFH